MAVFFILGVMTNELFLLRSCAVASIVLVLVVVVADVLGMFLGKRTLIANQSQVTIEPIGALPNPLVLRGHPVLGALPIPTELLPITPEELFTIPIQRLPLPLCKLKLGGNNKVAPDGPPQFLPPLRIGQEVKTRGQDGRNGN